MTSSLRYDLAVIDAGVIFRALVGNAKVDALKAAVQPGNEMVTAALRYTLSHPAVSTVIPGAKSPIQARINAAAGGRTMSAAERSELTGLLA